MAGAARKCMGMPGNAWEWASMRRSAWECVGMCGSAWECVGLRGNARECVGVRGNARECAGMRGNIWECAGIRGYASEHFGSALVGMCGTSRAELQNWLKCVRECVRNHFYFIILGAIRKAPGTPPHPTPGV